MSNEKTEKKPPIHAPTPVAAPPPPTQAETNAAAQKEEDAKIAARERQAAEDEHLAKFRAAPVAPLTTRAPLTARDEESMDMSNEPRSHR